MREFRRLPGLPPYGPEAIAFPPEWGMRGKEGLVVEFRDRDGVVWCGNFRPGLTLLDEVLGHPNGREVLVISHGALWAVNPGIRVGEELSCSVSSVWEVGGPEGIVLAEADVRFMLLDRGGVRWRTRRISWDGFDKLQFEARQLSGLAWSPVEDKWLPFAVNLETGAVEGGSYVEPEAEP